MNKSNMILSFQALIKLYTKMQSVVAQRYELNKTEVDILLFLYNNPDFDTARDIAGLCGIVKSYVSKSIECLANKGYLTLWADKKDRRKVHLTLEKKSEQVAKEAAEVQKEYFSLLYQGITEEEKAMMDRILVRIFKNVKEAFEQ